MKLKCALALLLPALFATAASAQTGNPGGAINDNLGEADYGVCRGVDPVCYHNWPRAKTTQYRILVYTHTAGPRHAGLGKPLGPGLDPKLDDSNVIQREMLRIAHENGWIMDYTEDVSEMRNLSGYNAVIFLSTTRDNLDDAGKTALRQYMRAGGGFVGIHNAFGTLYNWPYYEGLLGGANYYDHGPLRDGDVVVVDPNDVSTSSLPSRWVFRDEWYNLVPFPTHVRFLATIDESSWSEDTIAPSPWRNRNSSGAPANIPPQYRQRLPSVVGHHPGHGTFHPVAWCQYYDGGKAWLTTLGHDADAYKKDGDFPGAAQFQKLIVGGIKSVMGEEPFCK